MIAVESGPLSRFRDVIRRLFGDVPVVEQPESPVYLFDKPFARMDGKLVPDYESTMKRHLRLPYDTTGDEDILAFLRSVQDEGKDWDNREIVGGHAMTITWHASARHWNILALPRGYNGKVKLEFSVGTENPKDVMRAIHVGVSTIAECEAQASRFPSEPR